jgi:hypothetical protein
MRNTTEDLNGSVTVLERRTKPVTVFLDVQLLEGLREVAAANERPMSGEIRHLIRRYVEDPEDFRV